jgi:hypothetical protein
MEPTLKPEPKHFRLSRTASCPTNISPSPRTNADDGKNSLPALSEMIDGTPESIVATALDVVPKSIPIIASDMETDLSSIDGRASSRQVHRFLNFGAISFRSK